MVVRDGKVGIEGTEAELEAVRDPYISKFRKQGGG